MGRMIALPPIASQIPGEHSCFLVTKATDRQHLNLESLVLALTRIRDFLVETEVTSLSLPLYDPNMGKKHPKRATCRSICNIFRNGHRGLLT